MFSFHPKTSVSRKEAWFRREINIFKSTSFFFDVLLFWFAAHDKDDGIIRMYDGSRSRFGRQNCERLHIFPLLISNVTNYEPAPIKLGSNLIQSHVYNF